LTPEYEFVVIGAGMAGSSVAANLAVHASVRLLEMEDQPGYHSTGRSAAIFSEAYGNELVRAITRAGRAFFYSPPPDFTSIGLVKPRQVLIIARSGQERALEDFLTSTEGAGGMERISVADALSLCPVLRPSELAGAALTRDAADIEVHELQRGYLRRLKACRGSVSTGTRVIGIDRVGNGWTISTTQGLVFARTIEEFYLKPDAGMLLLSPADETRSAPCDAQADDLDIATAVDHLERATTLQVDRIAHRWAGLRSFVGDESPVLGYDELQPGFFWLAALGGYGIQTAPAIGQIAASLALHGQIEEHLLDFGINPALMSPARLLHRGDAKLR